MKEERDLQNLIKKLSPEASLPSLAFERRLQKKLVRKNKGPFYKRAAHSFNEFLFGIKGIPVNNFGLLTTTVLFIAAAMAGLIIWRINQGYTFIEQQQELSAQESYAVLSSIYQNNPQALLSVSSQTSLLAELVDRSPQNDPVGLNDTVLLSNTGSSLSLPKNFNFYQVSYQSTPGPKADTCATLVTDNANLTTYTYELQKTEGDTLRYFKYVNRDSDGTVLSAVTTDNAGTLIYQGGSYLARIVDTSEPATVTPTITTTPADPELEQLFGKSSVIRKVMVEGKIYYEVITTTSEYLSDYCEMPQEDINRDKELVIVNRIDPKQDYEITSTSYYLGRILPSDLILTTSTEYFKANYTPEQALDLYFDLSDVLPYELPVREFKAGQVDTTTSEAVVEAALETLKENNIPLLLSTALPAELSSFADNGYLRRVYQQEYSFNWDEEFFSPTLWEVRKQTLENETEENNPFTYYQASEQGNSLLTFNISNGVTESICNNAIKGEVQIDGKAVEAEFQESQSLLVCFSYNGWRYELNVYPETPAQVNALLRFRSLEPNNTKEEREILRILEQSPVELPQTGDSEFVPGLILPETP